MLMNLGWPFEVKYICHGEIICKKYINIVQVIPQKKKKTKTYMHIT
jgi:hypothetical protein